MTKKFITGLALASMLPMAASAATVEELQAQINALMAQLSAAKPAATASCSAAFSKTLKAGMSDAEVMELQKLLNSDVATQVAASGVGSKGNETKYFGAATKAAVVKFQEKYASEVLSPAGLSTGTGLVGAATRAKLNALCTKSTGTTTTGNTTTVTGLQGGAGSFSIENATGDVEDDVVTGQAETVLSFKGTADGSDVKVSHLKVKLTYTGSQSNQLGRYFTKFDVYAGATKVGSVDAADFTRDSSGHYSKTIALDGAVVKMGASNKVTFYVKATGVSAIDSLDAGTTWTVEATEARFADATGVVLSTQAGEVAGISKIFNSGIIVKKLSNSSDVKAKYSAGASNPEEKVVFVSDDNSGDKVTMLEFKVKAEGTDMSFDKATVAADVTDADIKNMVSEFQLVKGTEVLDTVDANSMTIDQNVVFDLDTATNIAKDATETFKVVAKMLKITTSTTTPTGFENGDKLKVSFVSTNVQDKNGDSVTTTSGSATGKDQTFRATGINFSKVSSTNTINTNSNDSAKSYGEFKMQVKVTASGDDIWVPLTIAEGTTLGTGINFSMLNSAGTATTSGSASVTLISGGSRENTDYVKIADGESATLEAVVTLDPAAAGQYRLQINNVGYTLTGATGFATAQIAGTPVQDFQSSLSFIQN